MAAAGALGGCGGRGGVAMQPQDAQPPERTMEAEPQQAPQQEALREATQEEQNLVSDVAMEEQPQPQQPHQQEQPPPLHVVGTFYVPGHGSSYDATVGWGCTAPV